MLGKFDFMPLKKVSRLRNYLFHTEKLTVSSLETNSFRLGNNLFEGRRQKFRPFELTKKLSFTVSFNRS